MATRPPAAEARLSRLQRRLLRQLQAQEAWIRACGDARAQVALFAWGIPWRPGAPYARWTASRRAAYSRALRRLEQRGLLLRVRRGRTRPSRRTTHVRLLTRWEAVAPWSPRHRVTRSPNQTGPTPP
jgi:hypothetical protein